MHTAAPEVVVLPSGHTNGVSAPRGQYEPAGHCAQELEPETDEYDPPSHCVQDDELAIANVPARHSVGTLVLLELHSYPAGQGKQAVSFPGEYSPSEQATGSDVVFTHEYPGGHSTQSIPVFTSL